MKAKRALIAREAAEWFGKLQPQQDGNLPPPSDAELTEYRQWLRLSKTHVQEVMIAAIVQRASRKAASKHKHDAAALTQRARLLLATASSSGHPDILEGADIFERRSSPPSHQARLVASLAALALTALLGWIVKSAVFDHTIETAVGDARTLTLDDRTIVRLAPLSRVRIDFADHERRVHLIRGEAFFSVSKDARRPFVVETELASVNSIATQFAVERRDQRVVVTVAEGAVRVSRATMTAAGTDGVATVAAGQQLDVSSQSALTPRPVDTARALAWVHGRLVFENDRVGDVVAEFNRRNRQQIVVTDEWLMNERVSGIFDAHDPRSLVDVLLEARPDTAVHEEHGVLRVESPQRYTLDPSTRDRPR
jgi:transmembrane sensor